MKNNSTIVKRAAKDVLNWLILVLGLNVILVPVDLLFHQPILGGLVDMFINDTNRIRVVLVVVVVVALSWLLIFYLVWQLDG
ncbi:hypothetical protein PL11_005375 [Lentilactobacillus curieae]|uniref:Uncharacterized protein n=1 Tax=Lentilactobacillus curieae TaxID=1138822 RepID=A0A1S6QIH7_9LACO|nr:hypothetical protein [Lentilactobacillus curieae]AQW21401.1 hypothetical protein PL11_005375 [Lentilactobacillus curieae]